MEAQAFPAGKGGSKGIRLISLRISSRFTGQEEQQGCPSPTLLSPASLSAHELGVP